MKAKQNVEKCNTNPIGKYIRIALSLFVIGFGLYHKNPIGLLGLMTLYTAISGNCGFSIKLNKSKHASGTGVIKDIEPLKTDKD